MSETTTPNSLPAPIMLESILPACYIEKNTITNNTNNPEMIRYSLKQGVNFKDNPQVQDYNYYGIKVVDAYTNQYLYTSTWRKGENLFLITNKKDKVNALKAGSGYYKIYLAYANTNNPGSGETIVHYEYSTPALFKLTEKPTLSIEQNGEWFIGTYSNDDKSEREYEYKFEIKDRPHITSGWQVHEEDKVDRWSIVLDGVYEVVYTVRTINGLEESITSNPIGSASSFVEDTDICKLVAESNKELGCVDLTLSLMPKTIGNDSSDLKCYYQHPYTLNTPGKEYKFILYKKNQEFNSWYKLKKSNGEDAEYILKFINGKSNSFTFHDYAIEHGAPQEYKAVYIYSSTEKEYNKTIATNSYFEDMFLEDEKRSVRIHFNPKVSSFKRVIPESKLETIGNKYPFFFRNAQVEYVEMTISGLISYLMDVEKHPEVNYRKETPGTTAISDAFVKTTNLTDENIYHERDYKMELYKWLTNGEPKLFRSPTEGNYVIRLMNVSLTPNDQLGRMLHTFQATAYEVADAKKAPYYPQFYKGGN